ncbi:hypothetical protein H6G98_29215 [Nostoc sp. FACHB-857]|nr:hypothetical protein [Nostoc sp. FACHB-857]
MWGVWEERGERFFPYPPTPPTPPTLPACPMPSSQSPVPSPQVLKRKVIWLK